MFLSEGGTYQVVGRTGSGKTMYAVRAMIRLLMAGKVVYSNVKLNWPAVLAYAAKRGIKKIPEGNYRYVPEGSLENFQRLLTPGSAIYIDEAQLVWNARDFGKTDKTQREMLQFLTQARHQKCTICMITQHENNVDAQVARIAVAIVRMRNLLQWPGFEFCYSILGKPKWMQISFAAVCDRDGKTILERDSFVRSAEIGNCYDTTQMHGVFELGGAPAEKVEGEVRIGKPGRILVAIGLGLVTAAYACTPNYVPDPLAPLPAKPVVASVAPAVPALPVLKPPTVEPPAGPQNASAAGTKGKKGLAGFLDEGAENWCTEAESQALPRYYRASDGRILLVNVARPYVVGDAFLGAIIRGIVPESPISCTVIISKPTNPSNYFYVRLYNVSFRNGPVVGDSSVYGERGVHDPAGEQPHKEGVGLDAQRDVTGASQLYIPPGATDRPYNPALQPSERIGSPRVEPPRLRPQQGRFAPMPKT